MIKLDYALMDELGLGSLGKETKDSLLASMYERLEMNVGTVIAADLSQQQLTEFEELIDSNDQQGALSWLQANYPNYKQVVERELERLKAEVAQSSQQIIEHEQSQAK